jgi:hypothetical protein
MRLALFRWWPRPPARAETLTQGDHRPLLAAAMCRTCARRWLAGRSTVHPWCTVELRHAFDLYFERLHGEP